MIHKLARHTVITALLIAISMGFAFADPGPGITKDDLKQIIPLKDVKAGMRGYGLTVFKGTKIEKFDVEVLGILRKVNNGHDLILVRMSGGPITSRGANIIGGMSGSPVYVNGKVIGAVAYGNAFPKEPIGMLTPIEDMLESLDPYLPSKPSGLSSLRAELDEPVKVDGRTYTDVEIDTDQSADGVSAGSTLMMRPLMAPLTVSGMSGKGLSKLNKIVQPFGLQAMAGPGAGSESVKVQLTPGAAVGVSLARGDVDITGVGTLTYKRGNKVIAFGHPMLGIGAIDAAMTTAYVHDVFPSVMVSNKIASPMDVVGRITQDRPFSVGGEIGKMPNMIPVTINLKDLETKRNRNLNIKVINHPLLAPKLIALVCGQGIAELRPTPGDAMAKVTFEVDADEVGKIRRENMFFDPIAIGDSATGDLQDLLMLLSSNRFYPLDVKSVKLAVNITSGHDTAVVERIFLDETKYEPGDTVKVGVVLRPYKQEPVTKTVDVKIPEYVPNGRLTIQVNGGQASGIDTLILSAASGDSGVKLSSGGSGSSTAENVRQLVNKYLENEKNNELVVKLVLGSALNVGGEKLSRLPSNIADIMKSAQTTGLRQERDEIKSVMATDYLVSGSQSLSVTVQRKDHSDQSSSQKPSSGSSSESPSSPSSSPSGMSVIEGDFDDEDSSYDLTTEPMSVDSSENVQMSEPAAEAPKKVIFTVASPVPVPAGSYPMPGAPKSPTMASSTSSSAKASSKFVGRSLSTWKQTSLQDFAGGTFAGTAVTTANDVRLAPTLKKTASLGASFIWSIIADGNGGAYAGTGNKGIIYRIDKNGKVSEFYKTSEIAVHSLAKDSAGNVYAGTSPNGKVFKINQNGTGSVVLDSDEKYVLALASGKDGNIYAGMGDGGKIYRISPDSKSQLLAELPENQILSLAVDPAGNVYAGTGTKGVAYKITSSGAVRSLYDASQESITAIAVDDKGNVYAGTNGKGTLYRIDANGAARMIYDKFGSSVLSLSAANGDVYAAAGDSIYKIASDETVYTLDTHKERVQFISVAVDGAGSVFAGTSNAGGFFSSVSAGGSDVFESTVHDTKVASTWGPISWTGKVPAGAVLEVQTRTGNVVEPDSTWSNWSTAYRTADGERIQSPSGRYIQYRVTFKPGKDGTGPELKDITVKYLPANQNPTVKFVTPQGGEQWSKTQTVKWSGSDPDNDTLTYDLYYSTDGGATWKMLDRRVKSSEKTESIPSSDGKTEPVKKESNSGSTRLPALTPEQIMSKMKAELEKYPGIPQDVRGRILAELPEMSKEAAEKAKDEKEATVEEEDVEEDVKDSQPSSSKETSYSWNTSTLPDGRYVIKVVASDRTSNPAGYLAAEAVSDPFVVANKAPKLYLFKKTMTIEKDKTVKLAGYTIHNMVSISGVQFKIDNGDWMAASPDDGMYDDKGESFTITTLPLSKGMHTIEVESIDAAGNTANSKTQVNVP